MPVTFVPHDLKHVAPHFNDLDLRNAMVALTVPVESCDSNGGTTGIT